MPGFVDEAVAQLAENLLSMPEALGSLLSTAQAGVW